MDWAIVLILIGSASFILLVILLVAFWGLMFLQLRVWLLARQGYQQVEHIGEDKVRRYYFLRPKDDNFEFEGGIYIYQKDSMTKTGSILRKVDKELVDGKEEKINEEFTNLKKQLTNLKYTVDSVTLRWGIPTISYYGNDPNPVNFSDRKKVYDSKNISAMIHRLMLTKEWKLVKLVMYLCAISIIISVGLGMLTYQVHTSDTQTLKQCITMLNESTHSIENYLNLTTNIVRSNSGVPITI